MATTRKASSPVVEPPAPVIAEWGEYRCAWLNEFNRPCNKLLAHGSGAIEIVCPRCRNKSRFEMAKAPLER